MNCSEWKQQIALFVGDDLQPADAAKVHRHLAECADCRQLSADLRETLALAQSVHSDPIDPAHYTAVRTRVLARIASDQPSRWRRKWMFAPLLAGAIVLAILAIRPMHPPDLPVLRQPNAPAIPAADLRASTPVPSTPEPRTRRVRPRRLVAAADLPAVPTPSAEPTVVKWITDDPDVVIYWIADK